MVSGESADAYLDYLCTNSISDMAVGQCRYTLMCYPNGTVVDDLLIYRRTTTSFLVVMNASNTDKDLAWIQSDNPHAHLCPQVVDLSVSTVQLALQGPLAEQIYVRLFLIAPDQGLYLRSQCEVGEVMASSAGPVYRRTALNSTAQPMMPPALGHLLEAGKDYGLILVAWAPGYLAHGSEAPLVRA